MTNVLLIEDDSAISGIITYYLEEMEQYRVILAPDIQTVRSLRCMEFDVILLDVMLPDGDGVTLCRELRQSFHCPILFISCIDDNDTIIRALENGGDDYIVKPFSNQVLHARIQANIRRVSMDRNPPPCREMSAGSLRLDLVNKTLHTAEGSYSLGNIELRLLAFFFEHPRQYFMSGELYRLIWGKPSMGDTRTVMVHICNIRKKIEKDPANPTLLRNVVGKGYIFDVPPEQDSH